MEPAALEVRAEWSPEGQGAQARAAPTAFPSTTAAESVGRAVNN